MGSTLTEPKHVHVKFQICLCIYVCIYVLCIYYVYVCISTLQYLNQYHLRAYYIYNASVLNAVLCFTR